MGPGGLLPAAPPTPAAGVLLAGKEQTRDVHSRACVCARALQLAACTRAVCRFPRQGQKQLLKSGLWEFSVHSNCAPASTSAGWRESAFAPQVGACLLGLLKPGLEPDSRAPFDSYEWL